MFSNNNKAFGNKNNLVYTNFFTNGFYFVVYLSFLFHCLDFLKLFFVTLSGYDYTHEKFVTAFPQS